MLEIKNIDVFYGDVQVIWDISFDVKQGEIVALIGANGKYCHALADKRAGNKML